MHITHDHNVHNKRTKDGLRWQQSSKQTLGAQLNVNLPHNAKLSSLAVKRTAKSASD
jgi:hypothetical protein